MIHAIVLTRSVAKYANRQANRIVRRIAVDRFHVIDRPAEVNHIEASLAIHALAQEHDRTVEAPIPTAVRRPARVRIRVIRIDAATAETDAEAVANQTIVVPTDASAVNAVQAVDARNTVDVLIQMNAKRNEVQRQRDHAQAIIIQCRNQRIR